jgi:hypothetical protein
VDFSRPVQGRAPTGSSPRCISNSRAAAEGGAERPGERHTLDQAEAILHTLKLAALTANDAWSGASTQKLPRPRCAPSRTRMRARVATRASPGRVGVSDRARRASVQPRCL